MVYEVRVSLQQLDAAGVPVYRRVGTGQDGAEEPVEDAPYVAVLHTTGRVSLWLQGADGKPIQAYGRSLPGGWLSEDDPNAAALRHLIAVQILQDTEIKGGVLTINHPASSDDEPIFLYKGNAYGPTEPWPELQDGVQGMPTSDGGTRGHGIKPVWQVLEEEAKKNGGDSPIVLRFVTLGRQLSGLL